MEYIVKAVDGQGHSGYIREQGGGGLVVEDRTQATTYPNELAATLARLFVSTGWKTSVEAK